MTDKRYTQEELDNMKRIEHIMQLNMMKKGLIITDRQVAALNYFFGDAFKQIATIPLQTMSIHFDSEGKAYRTDNVDIEMTANDVPIPRKPLEGNNELQDS